MMKIMVIDTQGPYGISPEYRAHLPAVRIRGVEPSTVDGSSCHPHGLMAGYYAACLLHPVNGWDAGEVELVFARIFDTNAKMLGDVDGWLLDLIARERPMVISRSWGGVYGEGRLNDLTGQVMWREWISKYRGLQAEIGFVDFASAGNSGDWVRGDDTGYPQRLMPDVSNMIGSCRRDGLPSEFSSDGPGVQCVAWGERIRLLGNAGWELGSGTSFSCPKMAGLCAARRLDHAGWRSYVTEAATRPAGFERARSDKWGQGNMEDAFQEMFRKLPADVLPPGRVRANIMAREKWFEFGQAK